MLPLVPEVATIPPLERGLLQLRQVSSALHVLAGRCRKGLWSIRWSWRGAAHC